jgi:hypothetical protein
MQNADAKKLTQKFCRKNADAKSKAFEYMFE